MEASMPTVAVIGEGNLPLYCLQMCAEFGLSVTAVFSDYVQITSYCDTQRIPVFPGDTLLTDVLSAARPDYIFSIRNPRVLKRKEIATALRFAINYHDSPLPSFAGVNATSWAIIEGQTHHGVTWHVIEPRIDTGDILVSECFEISDDDSAFTLNLKCQSAAKRTFKCLLKDVLENSLCPVPQDACKRSYYGLYKLLPFWGILNLHSSFNEINKLVRGLEFGHSDNQLGVAKIRTDSGVFLLVKAAERVKLDGNCVPGTILNVSDETIVVSTSTEPILLNLALLDGRSVTMDQFNELGLKEGKRMQESLVTLSAEDEKLLVSLRKMETVWVQNILKYEPVTFFRQKLNVISNIMDASKTLNVQHVRICQLDYSVGTEYLHAAFLAFLARIACASEMGVAFLADKSVLPEYLQPNYTNLLPCTFHIKFSSSSCDAISKLQNDIRQYRLRKPFLKDLYYRYPNTKKTEREPFHNIIIGTDTLDLSDDVFFECNLLVLFASVEGVMKLMYNKRPGQDYSYVIETLRHFPNFLQSVMRDPNCHLTDVCLVSQSELKTLYSTETIETNSTSSLVDELILKCRDTPDNIALRSTNEEVTYKHFHKLANKLSRQLINCLTQQRVDQTTVAVGLFLTKTVSYVISMFAVLKSGLYFLPLPVDHPTERTEFALLDSQTRFVLSTEDGFHNIKRHESHELARINVSGKMLIFFEWIPSFDSMSTSESWQSLISQNVDEKSSTDNEVCYIMYTSGSTGKPKGVKVRQSSVLNMARAQIESWALIPKDVTAQFASIGFDASISEIFTALLSGGTLAILEKDNLLGREFIKNVRQLQITTITLPPSVLNVYSPQSFPTLKNVISAGEPCTYNIALKWTKETDINFFNAYGPTETTVCASIYKFDPADSLDESNRDLPVGQPINGNFLLIFDDFMKPVPPGIVGHIFIGGKGLSLGYIGHASMFNSESFLQNPLQKNRNLLYKTGDHGFHEANGNITFVGRRDEQVKIRGHRIDLNEIEQVLIQHIMVQVAVAVVHQCPLTKEPVICAFVAPDIAFVSELKEFLAKVLPNYMIPTHIKKLRDTDFPKTSNGKIDRKALSRDESVHEEAVYVGSSHLNEEQLAVAKIWCDILQLDESVAYTLYRTKSFCEFGGNSLHLVLLQRQIEMHFEIVFPFSELVIADTIEKMASGIRRKRTTLEQKLVGNLEQSEQLKSQILSDSQLIYNEETNTVFGVNVAEMSSLPLQNKTTPMSILVSGVTGFLGAFLLKELLENTVGNICCMVRETSEVRGFGRLVENMRNYDLWKYEYQNRIAVVPSDLTQTRLGMAPNIYDSLTRDIDAVFLNAAMMNFNGSYSDHRQTNVLGTQEFIKFAVTSRRKYLFMVSSLGVLLFPCEHSPNGERTTLSESDVLDNPLTVEGGYGQSKWTSERLVFQALDFLPGGAIFRPARVSGRSGNGRGPGEDLFASILIGMKRLGSYPDLSFPFDLVPVDFCAKAIVEIACKVRRGHGSNKIFHIYNKATVPFKNLFKGMNLTCLPLEKWREQLKLASKENKQLIPLTPFFMSAFWDRAKYWPLFDTTNTDALVSDTTKQIMKPAADLLEVYKRFFGIFET